MKRIKLIFSIISIFFIFNFSMGLTPPILYPGKPEKILMNNYKDIENHYSIRYPENWMVEKPEKGIVIFSGKEKIPYRSIMVNIQVIRNEKYTDIKALMNTFKEQVKKQFTDYKFEKEGKVKIFKSNGETLFGEYFIVNYSDKEGLFKHLQFVFFENKQKIFYSFGYTAHIDQYNTYIPIVKSMIKTWEIH